MHLTNKQTSLMQIIVAGNITEDGSISACDLDQIIERVHYHPTKDAIQFSIRKLIAKGLIEKSGMERRRERRHVLISATKLGKQLFEVAKTNPSWLESADELENL